MAKILQNNVSGGRFAEKTVKIPQNHVSRASLQKKWLKFCKTMSQGSVCRKIGENSAKQGFGEGRKGSGELSLSLFPPRPLLPRRNNDPPPPRVTPTEACGPGGSDYFRKAKKTARTRQAKEAAWFQWRVSPRNSRVTTTVKTVSEITSWMTFSWTSE